MSGRGTAQVMRPELFHRQTVPLSAAQTCWPTRVALRSIPRSDTNSRPSSLAVSSRVSTISRARPTIGVTLALLFFDRSAGKVQINRPFVSLLNSLACMRLASPTLQPNNSCSRSTSADIEYMSPL